MNTKYMPMIDVDVKDAAARAFILFIQTSDIVKKYGDARLYREGLSIIKFMVLKVLELNGGTMIPSEIAKWTLRERHDITTLVDRLKRDGLVSTERSTKDKRYINVSLTDKGREAISQCSPAAKDIIDQVMRSIDEGAALSLEGALKVMRQNTHDEFAKLVEKPVSSRRKSSK